MRQVITLCSPFTGHLRANNAARTFESLTGRRIEDTEREHPGRTHRNLWHDGSLFKWSTWRSCGKLLLARDGMIRGNIGLWRDYMHKDFNPSQHPAELSQQWLRANTAQFSVIEQAG